MAKKILLFIMLTFSVATGGFWVLQAQDPPSNVRTDPPTVSATTQTDLSGTYTGTFNCEPLGLMGETTLTISGNEFTTADGKSGRIVASTSGGYTAVVLQMGGTGATSTATTAPATAPVIVSMRGRKAGNRLILTPVSGTTMKCSFTPGRGTARTRRTPRTPAATGTEVANPATSPSPAESPSPTESPSPMPEQTPSPSPSPTPTPAPEPTPNPSPEPVPSPTPGGSPMPTPSPSPGEPMPSPTPSPSPGR
jgi:hypothetical protein